MTRVVPGPPPEPSNAQRAALNRLAMEAKNGARRAWILVAAALSEWCVIGACVAAVGVWPSAWLTVLAVVVIGCRQQGLAVLMHEGVHRHFHREERTNDWIADLLCAWPVFTSTRAYRASHLQHHRLLHQERDPDWVMRHDLPEWDFPMPLGKLLWVVGSLGLGRGVYAFFRANKRMAQVSEPIWSVKESGGRRLVRALVAFGPMGLAVWSGMFGAYFVLWVVPLLTVVPVVVRLRVIGEHYGLPADSVFSASRDWNGGAVLNWLVVPWGIRLHRTHHLFPGVPFYELQRVQDLTRADAEIGALCPLQSAGQVLADLTSRVAAPDR